MPGGSLKGGQSEAAEFAAYVAALTSELSKLARSHRLSTLAYLLEMAGLEARCASREDTGTAQTGK
ncbi:MAG: hypothetical protein B7Z15_05435 [Rhizobiales bacterium 32-66-8]|nr:MAG: hypothetical protein B7Z15_05435 [Rhizobiales bacterium 32-66-8]